ncbi:MAG: TetM/TetW/TetO/TetS family tetracycline resistance ribosomal protection protein [Faecalibacterium sp.]|jgi:small GTP-binding protein|nr:TetM/TetW/TetO/TetS family tetracycline resistance ribosomal protection protein [Faecalibacterium sp.]
MKQLVIGILAHVDAGKTTLSEALLYQGGAVRKLGRVDHGDAFLDTATLEKARGITIFSKCARLHTAGAELTLLDTPGHVDFSAEMERTLGVLDYAVLVVSGTDGVQSHTETLWKLLAQYQVPVFLFVNKMDLPGKARAALLDELGSRFSDACVDFSADAPEETRREALSLCDEALLDEVLAGKAPQDATIADAVARRRVFPVYFGAALKTEGVDALLEGLGRYTAQPKADTAFGARIYKITEEGGTRLTWLKVTGGQLAAKTMLESRPDAAGVWREKADQLRLYSGEKFTLTDVAVPGMAVAVTGLTQTHAGEGLGAEANTRAPVLAPVLHYAVQLPEGTDGHAVLLALRTLEQEDPQLHVVYSEALNETHVQLMGEVQLEVLQSLLQERFGLTVSFGPGNILYKETITTAAEGIGHYEPLRHYAEVHLVLEPGARGSGLVFSSACPTDALDKNWQHLILTHLAEKQHAGVLMGAPLTDVKITLIAGRASEKHTEGGDFRQATYRAVRQGLRQAESILLEPWYAFSLELPAEQLGRAMADVQRMAGRFDAPETHGDSAILSGEAPVATMRAYPQQVAGYTRGRGRITLTLSGYAPCHNAEEILRAAAYDPDTDLENPTCSVFCSHGAGFSVKWSEVPARAHIETGWGKPAAEDTAVPPAPRRVAAYCGTLAEDKELLAIFEHTYGPLKKDVHHAFRPAKAPAPAPAEPAAAPPAGPEYLLVDGYNVLNAWDDLAHLAQENLEAARSRLADILCNYQGYCKCEVILVFDAYRVKGGLGEMLRYHNIRIVYTKEAETADSYIERATHEIGKQHRVRVVTSDGAVQFIILGNGALRVSARAFRQEVDSVEKAIRQYLEQ